MLDLLGDSFAIGILAMVVQLALLFAIIAAIVRAVRGTEISPPLVVTDWHASDEPQDGDGTLVRIQGRPEGLVSWVMTLLRINPRYEFTVRNLSVSHEATSLSGYQKQTIPLCKLNRISHGLHRPWFATLLITCMTFGLASGVMDWVAGKVFTESVRETRAPFFIGPMTTVTVRKAQAWVPYFALFWGISVSLVAGAGYYLLNKRLMLSVGWGGKDSTLVLRYKRSVIEGMSIDEKAFADLAAIIQHAVDQYSLQAFAGPMEPRQRDPGTHRPEDSAALRLVDLPLDRPPTGTFTCTRCGRALPGAEDQRFCDECGGTLVLS